MVGRGPCAFGTHTSKKDLETLKVIPSTYRTRKPMYTTTASKVLIVMAKYI